MDDITETRPRGLWTATGTGFALILAGCLLTVGSAVLAISDSGRQDRALGAVVQVVCIALPVGLGLFRLSRQRDDRFALLLIGAGLFWSIVTLAQSTDPALYSIGRTAGWVVEVAIVYLLLAFPGGRLTSRAERRVFGGAVLLTALLYVPTAFLSEFPTPNPWSSCGTDCPQNALALGHGAESFIHDYVRPLREVLTVILFAAVALVIAQKARRGPRLMHQLLAPVAVVAILRVLTVAGYDALRGAGADGAAADVLGVIFELSLAFVTLAFAAGLLNRRMFVADALESLTRRLRPHASASDLRNALAEALEDPSLQVVYRLQADGGSWVDETGWPAKPPERGDGSDVTEVRDGDRLIAAIVHDASLSQDRALVQAAASYGLAALENERLVGRLNSSLEELSQSRARIVAVGDRERRRIERDLHDGAQQRLVALRVRLELVAEQVAAESPAVASAIRDLEGQVDETIDDVRAFARGIYPALLAERGISEALRAAGRNATVPTIVDAAGLRRFPPEIEATVYFACMEALQNAAKHAHASGVTIAVSQNPHLRFEVSDDGDGFDPAIVAEGHGITGLNDRLDAVGGKLTVKSAPGEGTRISGVIPVNG
jgi:signal transduction histidine kinase